MFLMKTVRKSYSCDIINNFKDPSMNDSLKGFIVTRYLSSVNSLDMESESSSHSVASDSLLLHGL